LLDGGRTCPPVWTAYLDGGVVAAPAVADGVVYVATRLESWVGRPGLLYAFSARSPGRLLWTGEIGLDGAYMGSSPTVANGVVYVGSLDSKLYAFPVGCRRNDWACPPLWTGKTGDLISSTPAVADGVVYVTSQDGKLYAFAARCGTGGALCDPLWTGRVAGGSARIAGSPAVANGVVYVASTDGNLNAFAVGCAAGGATCAPTWSGVVGGDMWDAAPAVANGVLYVGSDHGLYAWDLGDHAPAAMAP
jgi:outer membrane protein assembly factor BamB